MKESDIQQWIKKYMESAFEGEIYSFKVPQGQYTSRRGIPDLVFSIRGRFVAIEVKMPRGKLTKLQDYELGKINRAGGIALVVYGKDKPGLDHLIDQLKESA